MWRSQNKTKERQPFDRRLGLKAKLEAMKPTTFKDLEPLYKPTKFDIEQKQEVVKRKKRDK